MSEAWRVQFAVAAQRSGFETRAPIQRFPNSEAARADIEPGSDDLTKLTDLPDDVISKILGHCSFLERCSLAQTSTRLLHLASQEEFWENYTDANPLKRAIALCMSSILHLPPQVDPPISASLVEHFNR